MFSSVQPKIFVVALILAMGTLLPQVGQSEECQSLLKKLITNLNAKVALNVDLDNHLNHRNFIAQLAKNKRIPVFLKQNDHGIEIPVILINKITAKKMAGFIENSFGTQVALQKNWDNDHGLLRTGQYIIDMDYPGARGFGEIEQTGLAWKNIFTYLSKRAEAGGTPTLEVAYLLTPDEKSIIDYYQKVRRAALFRVKFTFVDDEQTDYPNLLKGGGEHCFIFCKAEAVSKQSAEIKKRLLKLDVQSPDELLKDPKIQQAITIIQKIFNEYDPDQLNSKVLNNPNIFSLLKKAFPKSINNAKKLEIVNWLISYDASKRYKKVLSNLGVSGDYGTEDTVNIRASALLVYDEGANVEQFTNATYRNNGKMFKWPKTKQRPMDL